MKVSKANQRLRWFNFSLKCLVIPVLVPFVLLAIPLVGNFLVIEGASLLGCNTGEDEIHPCYVMGRDIGEFVSGYVVDVFVAGGFNPFLAYVAFKAFISSFVGIVWMLVVSGTFVAREIKRGKLIGSNDNAG